ncbi:MAG: methionine ABC transporter ATP-binding protein [Sporomusaceae bacterium]|nr:methionine ABC transporter ATP-binding protein [Sporomusaceae bacterium]
MIKLSNIVKSYPGASGPVQALKGISLQINSGEIFGVIGKSGAGKSTLIRCINMLEKPTGGSVIVDGEELSTMSEKELRNARKKIGMIFQHFNLLSSRTVYDNIAFPLELAGWDKKKIEAAVAPLLDLVGLTDKRDQYPSQLSGGQKQRVGIARSLTNRPKVLLCDEATSALDPQTTQSILELLKDINRRLGLTIVLITHEMQVIKQICDRVAVIENGVIIEQGPVIDLFAKPETTTTREFIRTIINYDLPEVFNDTVFSPVPLADSHLIVRVSFLGKAAKEPIIASLIRHCNVDVSILFGNIDHIQNIPFGTLIMEVAGDAAAMQSALQFLTARDLGTEVIGYVKRDALAIS